MAKKTKKIAKETHEKLEAMEKYLAGVHHRRRVLSITVFCVTAIIIALWGFVLYGRFNEFSWHKTPEKQVVDSARAEWQMAQEIAGNNTKNQKIAEDTVKTKLSELLAAAAVASTTTTATAVEAGQAIQTSTTTSTQNN